METAIWIIAIIEVIRMIQNTLQLLLVSKSNNNVQFKKATDEFIKSLNKTDMEFVNEMLEQLKEKKNEIN